LNFLDRFEINAELSGFMKILPGGAELFRTDEQTDMTKKITAFRNFAKVPKVHETETLPSNRRLTGNHVEAKLIKVICQFPASFSLI
jgi:hypothetical protein